MPPTIRCRGVHDHTHVFNLLQDTRCRGLHAHTSVRVRTKRATHTHTHTHTTAHITMHSAHKTTHGAHRISHAPHTQHTAVLDKTLNCPPTRPDQATQRTSQSTAHTRQHMAHTAYHIPTHTHTAHSCPVQDIKLSANPTRPGAARPDASPARRDPTGPGAARP